MNAEANRLIVIGGSAGGLDAALKVVSNLDAELSAVVILVLHLGNGTTSGLLDKLQAAGPLDAELARDEQPLPVGRILVAPPGRHLVIRQGRTRLVSGPRVNLARPSIDLTMRSAAVARNSAAVGVVLSGMLDDGSAGLNAIVRCGGQSVVQESTDAVYPDMPNNAAAATQVNHRLPAGQIGQLLNELAATRPDADAVVSKELQLENRFDMNEVDDLAEIDQLGNRVPLACPECGGPTWEIDLDGSPRYRCHIGHSLSTQSMLACQEKEIEQALWTAYRSLEEKARLQAKMASRGDDASTVTRMFREREQETRGQAERLRGLLMQLVDSKQAPHALL